MHRVPRSSAAAPSVLEDEHFFRGVIVYVQRAVRHFVDDRPFASSEPNGFVQISCDDNNSTFGVVVVSGVIDALPDKDFHSRAHEALVVKKKNGQPGLLPAGRSASSAARWDISYPTRSCRRWASVSPRQAGGHCAPVVYLSQGWRVVGSEGLLPRSDPRFLTRAGRPECGR